MRGYPSKERKLSFLNLSQFGNSELAWEYSANTYKTTVQRSVAVQAIVQKLDQMMYADTNIYGFAILSGDGRNVVSTVEKKSRTGIMEIDEKTTLKSWTMMETIIGITGLVCAIVISLFA